jgi:hypothetical protein
MNEEIKKASAGDERAAFEAWVRRERPSAPLQYIRDALPENHPRYGEYVDGSLLQAWVGWQARARLNASRDVVPEGWRAERDDCIQWLMRIDGIGEARASLIYSMGFRRIADAPDHSADDLKMVSVPRELLDEAERCAFVLENIGSMDAEDIDGDDIDLRFEDEDGRDTGCDVSIVEYAERAAKVLRALLAGGDQ